MWHLYMYLYPCAPLRLGLLAWRGRGSGATLRHVEGTLTFVSNSAALLVRSLSLPHFQKIRRGPNWKRIHIAVSPFDTLWRYFNTGRRFWHAYCHFFATYTVDFHLWYTFSAYHLMSPLLHTHSNMNMIRSVLRIRIHYYWKHLYQHSWLGDSDLCIANKFAETELATLLRLICFNRSYANKCQFFGLMHTCLLPPRFQVKLSRVLAFCMLWFYKTKHLCLMLECINQIIHPICNSTHICCPNCTLLFWLTVLYRLN